MRRLDELGRNNLLAAPLYEQLVEARSQTTAADGARCRRGVGTIAGDSGRERVEATAPSPAARVAAPRPETRTPSTSCSRLSTDTRDSGCGLELLRPASSSHAHWSSSRRGGDRNGTNTHETSWRHWARRARPMPRRR